MFWKVEPEFSSFLRVLGFQELSRYPKMKDVVKMFRRTALKTHPDKPGGSTEEFQQLQEAFKKAGQFLETAKTDKVVEKEEEDVEECAARKLFKEFYVNGETYQSDFLEIFNEQHSLMEIAEEMVPFAPPALALELEQRQEDPMPAKLTKRRRRSRSTGCYHR